MQDFLLELLECPSCHGTLTWRIVACRGDRLEEGEATCTRCAATYPIREGIGIFLTPDLPRNDLWEQAESGITRYITDHPDVEQALLADPTGALPPADQFFRAMVLEDRGAYVEAQKVARST